VRLDPIIRRLARSAHLAKHHVVFEESGISVYGKPLALKRAIGNLLDNALFYGERAEVTVRHAGNSVIIAIRDHGPGVPEEALPSLFDPYLRLSNGREQNAGGMGLGLGIARSMIEAHGGTLVLENHPEGGLNAVITLPG
jgi:signal transduction histidine kinase